jgi:hypothetical protein
VRKRKVGVQPFPRWFVRVPVLRHFAGGKQESADRS